MSFSETAVKLHDEKKYNCCQAVFCSACGRCGIDEETGYRLGAFFGAGMRRGEVCGCVSGALMAIGMKYGDENNRQSGASHKFLKEFENNFGSLLCRELVKEKGKACCPQLIAFAANYLEEEL